MRDKNDKQNPGAASSNDSGSPVESAEVDIDATRVAVIVLAIVATILLLQFAKTVLLPLVVAILISYVLAPGVASMERRGVPRAFGSFVAIALLCGAIGLGAYTLTDQALAIVDNVPVAARRLVERLEQRG